MDWILRRSSRPCAIVTVALQLCPMALGQATGAPAGQPETVLDVLHLLSNQADVIFVGQVLAIHRPDNGVVQIEFRVDEAIRGCANGATYTLREWSGLWAVNNERYRVGQSLLMLLHAPSAAGMSSPVGGLDGAIPIRQMGTVADDSSTEPQRPYVDLRWLGARVPRVVSYGGDEAKRLGLPASSVAQRRTRAAAAGSVMGSGSAVPATEIITGANGSVAAQQASVDAVVGMLISWQKVRNGAS